MATTIGSFDLASLKNLRDDVTQYFWFESDSSSAWGSGAHVTLYPESQFTDSTNPNYMKGQNIIMNTDGFSIRNGALPMMVLDNDSLDFNAIDTTQGTYTTIATFGLTGAIIGRTGSAHSVIDADGQRFYASNGTTQLANIGYGEGQAESGTAVAPYYTFGIREDNSVIGNYSVAEGGYTTASGADSHAEGFGTTASGHYSHSEGYNTVASDDCAHAEGGDTIASGYYAHAEGIGTTASGDYSHSQNEGTFASGASQTAIGAYNKEDTDGTYLFIIGNGEGDDTASRSNALTVDWNGNVVASGGVTDGNNHTISRNNGVPRETVATGTNLNSVVTRGVYWLNGNNTYTNAPTSYGLLEVFNYYNATATTSNVITQRVTTQTEAWVRQRNSGTWSAWRPYGRFSTQMAISVETVSLTSASGAYQSSTKSVSKTGYYPVGIVGWYCSGTQSSFALIASLCLIDRAIGSATLHWMVRNMGTQTQSATLNVHVLWMRAEL